MRARVIMPPFLPSSVIDSLSEKDIIEKKVFLTEAKLQCQCPCNRKEQCILRKEGENKKYSLNTVKNFCRDRQRAQTESARIKWI